MGLVDVVLYIVLIIFFILAIMIEAKHYVCDSGTCAVIDWAKDRSNNDREKYTNIIDYTTRYSVWMKAFIASFLITLVAFLFFKGELPNIMHFLCFFLFVFFILYFIFTFYQHHFLAPINNDLKSYINAACSKDDPRLYEYEDE